MRVEKQKETIDLDRLIDNITLQSPNPSKEHSAEKSFSRLMARIQADNNSIDIFRRKASQYRVWLAAATVALLIAMSGWLYMMLNTDPSLIVTANNSGIVQNVILPDGSNIKLNNRSKLIYPERFSKDSREVFLEGEAYFDVAHDKRHPFIVRAGELKIKVLGTKFTVNANSQMPQITATLLEGSIDVADEKKHMLMKPNQQLTYNVGSGKMLLTEVANASRETRWTENIWVLSNTPLLDICQRLEQLFNVKFIIMNDELIGKSFTGEFYTNESLDSILKTMQISTPFKYEKKEGNIIIK
ncbi:FecR family protein [uncultured Bacteroides sp.]|uniref:FecR family protein n=1 Tax=uncultured Bacteroides sp. TaxID=162156 RepID=UPI0025E95077|nr:FecR domain-containing protein [uncultured Bacteroides sp.]